MIIIIIIFIIYLIILDESIISYTQIRIGPFNIGYYGLFSSLINGCNFIITQYLIPKINIIFGFQSFPIIFLLLSILLYILIYPFFLIDIYITLILIIIISSLSIIFIIFTAFPS